MDSHPSSQLRAAQRTDFALLQQRALAVLERFPGAREVFKHVIVDEYQDTNTVQERIYFTLDSGHRNFCVVGDDDQALYRFRGATVENFVEFPARCKQYLGVQPTQITLATNYRSRECIVNFYTAFIEQCNWRKDGGGHYRVADKNIRAHSTDTRASVVASTPGRPVDVAAEIADLVQRLIDTGKVENPNQVAFLFPSLKATAVEHMKHALEVVGLQVYAPRAGRFLEVEESIAVFGLIMQVFGRPGQGAFPGQDYNDYLGWLDAIDMEGKRLMRADPQLARFIEAQRAELQRVQADYQALVQVAHWRKAGARSVDERYEVVSSSLPSGTAADARGLFVNCGFRFASHRISLYGKRSRGGPATHISGGADFDVRRRERCH